MPNQPLPAQGVLGSGVLVLEHVPAGTFRAVEDEGENDENGKLCTDERDVGPVKACTQQINKGNAQADAHGAQGAQVRP